MSKKIHIPDEVLRILSQIEEKQNQKIEIPSLTKVDSEGVRRLTLDSRKALGITQSAVGDLSGITLSTVQKIERGDLKVNLQSFLKMMDVLGIEVCLKKK